MNEAKAAKVSQPGRPKFANRSSVNRNSRLANNQTIETKERSVSTVKWQLSWQIGGLYQVHGVQKTMFEACFALDSHSAFRRIENRSAEHGMSDARIHRRLCTAFHVHYQRIS